MTFRTLLLVTLVATGCGRDDPPDVADFVPVDQDMAVVSSESEDVTVRETPPEPERTVPEDVASNPGPAPVAPEEPPESPVAQAPADQPQQVFRPTVVLPRHDDERAAELGIQRYESRRLVLYTDIDPEIAATLPPLIDQAYGAWTEYFGPLPPDRDGTEYRMMGYIMEDTDRFRAAGMLPEEALRTLEHGLHRGAEFWMNEQDYDYYRRHLMLHEGTHCFMTVMPERLPLWYLEGMAELFGTHRLKADGTVEFRVMPDDPRDFVGFGRVEMIREEIEEGRARSVADVLGLSVEEFAESRKGPYAWSWAFCKFLDAHPRYGDRFRELSRHLEGEQFNLLMESAFKTDESILAVEWNHFARTLTYGYDIARSAIVFERGTPLAGADPASMELRSDVGWQPSGVWLEAGETYAVAVDGEVILANEPRPWISEPQGVSIEYSGGQPIGRAIAAIQSDQPPAADGTGSLLKTIDVGRSLVFTPGVSGTLYLRVNDAWNKLADNSGTYRVTILKDATSEPRQ
jgi:hypothetical protein